jgi:hypothetical protein
VPKLQRILDCLSQECGCWYGYGSLMRAMPERAMRRLHPHAAVGLVAHLKGYRWSMLFSA